MKNAPSNVKFFGGPLLSDGLVIEHWPLAEFIVTTILHLSPFSREFIGRHRTITFTASAMAEIKKVRVTF